MTLLLGDATMLALAFWLAYIIRFRLQVSLSPEVAPAPFFYLFLVLVLIPVWIGMFALAGLYSWKNLLGGTVEYSRAFNCCTTGMMLVVIATFVDPRFIVARGWLIPAWFMSVLLVCGARFGLRRVVYALRRKGHFLVPVVIVGTNGEACALAEQFKDPYSSGYRIVGLIEAHSGETAGETRVRSGGVPVLGCLDELEEIITLAHAREVVAAASSLHREELIDLYERVQAMQGVELRLSTGLFEVLTTGVRVQVAGTVPLISLNKLRLNPFEAVVKTVMEYSLTTVGLILLAPFLLVIAILIKLDSPGPVMHRRRVLGVGGRQFDAFKFRTMLRDGDRILVRHPELLAELQAEEKLKDDPRVTRLGRWLRRYSIDELPQLFNVLLGQMSLVGPRMISPQEALRYGRHKSNLFTVKPGITGLWQVSGRSDLSYDERVRLDMHYIRNYSIWLDFHILFVKTASAVIRGRGAY